MTVELFELFFSLCRGGGDGAHRLFQCQNIFFSQFAKLIRQ